MGISMPKAVGRIAIGLLKSTRELVLWSGVQDRLGGLESVGMQTRGWRGSNRGVKPGDVRQREGSRVTHRLSLPYPQIYLY